MNSNGRKGCELVDDQACTAVPGMNHHLEGLELRPVHVGQQMLDVGRHHVHRVPLAYAGRRPEARRFRNSTDVLQTIVPTDGPRFLADELHSVVVRGVVAGRNHDTPVHLSGEGREVDDFGAAQPHVVHVDTRIEKSLFQCARQLLAGEPDVASDDHPAGTARSRRMRVQHGRRRPR